MFGCFVPHTPCAPALRKTRVPDRVEEDLVQFCKSKGPKSNNKPTHETDTKNTISIQMQSFKQPGQPGRHDRCAVRSDAYPDR